MTDRRTEILQAAIELIADQGYASLTMRALARGVGMKLASLQYHFRSLEDLLRGIVGHVSNSYHQNFLALSEIDKQPDIRSIVLFIMDDEAGTDILGDRLWPQLWAMQQVEPLVADLVDDIYSHYLNALETALIAAGASSPHAESLMLMSMLEGSTIFMGEGRPWQKDSAQVRLALLKLIEERYYE